MDHLSEARLIEHVSSYRYDIISDTSEQFVGSPLEPSWREQIKLLCALFGADFVEIDDITSRICPTMEPCIIHNRRAVGAALADLN